MLSSKIRVVVLAGLLLAAPALSFAQGPGGGGRGGFGGFGRGGGGVAGLLRMEEVQKEIEVTADQKAELDKIAEAARAQPGAGGPGAGFNPEEFQKLSDEEKAKRFDEMRKQGEERTKKTDESIKAVFKPEQWARLSGLRAQREGLSALGREEVQKELGLNAEQAAKIKTLVDGNRPTFGGFGGPGGGDLSEEDMRKAREEREAKTKKFDTDMAAVLTADQTAALEKYKGAKFEFPARGGFGGPGGGRGGAGGGARSRPE